MKKTAFAALLLLHLAACSQTDNPKQQQDSHVAATPADTLTADSLANPNECQSNAPVFAPPTELIKDASLQAYLQEMELAVQQQDAPKLLSLLDPNIATGFDGSGGLESFEKRWNPASEDADLWPLLHQMLELGGTPMQQGDSSSNFALPYVYSAWPDSLDAFAYSAVVHDGAILRVEPAANAAAVCSLSQVILKVDYSKSYPQQDNVREKEWWYVASPDGRLKGYLYKSDLYSPVGYRAIFNKNKQGKWQMTALVSGD